MVDNFSPGWNFKLLNRDDDISSCMLMNNNLKTELWLYAKIIMVNRAKITPQFEQSKVTFSFQVNELKMFM